MRPAGAEKAPAATSTAAMPTSEWNAATRSGIEVIGTRRAIPAPLLAPTAKAPVTKPQTPRVAAEGKAASHNAPGDGISRRMRSERGQRRDGHAHHAELIAAPAGIRARQAAQRQDEQDAGDQIEQRNEVRAHSALTFSSSGTSPACAG